MATKIVTKNSSTASAVPTASDLVQGELAVNVADKRLFTEDNTGTIVELGTNPSTIDINAGSIDGTAIGASSASTGAFTTLTATGLTVDTNTLYVDSTNNRVGIGTTSPAVSLHVNGGTDNQIGLIESTDATVKLGFKDNSTTNNYSVTVGAVGDEMTFTSGSGGTEAMRIDSSGRVGIGTTSPSAVLHAKSSGELARLETTSSGGNNYLTFYKPSNTRKAFIGFGGGSADNNFYINNDENADIVFRPNNSEAMRLNSSGNLLVGVTTTSVTSGGFAFLTGAVDYQMIGHASGVASGNYYIGFAYNGSTVGAIVQNGTTGVAYNTSSDQRLKENIADADDAGSKIDAIQVRQYDWKADGSHQDYGVIAQELVEVAPEAVTVPADSEEMMGVDYSKLVPMLIKEIQSLRNRVAQLEE